MKVLTVTGFYSTGSSAVTDLIKECEGVFCKSDYEVRFLHDPDGVSDLEYHLIENPNRHNTSHAIKRFIKTMKLLDHVGPVKRYSKYLGNEFLPVTMNYVENITYCKYKSVWHYDVYERGPFFYLLSRTYTKVNTLLNKLFGIPLDGRGLVSKNEKAYLGILDETLFIQKTQEYVDNVLKMLCGENAEVIMVDQLVPPSNIERYSRYVGDIKVVIVDRDPRDIYLLEKEIFHGTIAPTESAVLFCKWYKWTREIAKNNMGDNVLKIRFEDLIYNYQETVDKVLSHFEIPFHNHVQKRKYFDPAKSIVNTRLWKTIQGYEQDIRYIEQELPEYCYPFPLEDEEMIAVDKRKIF